MSFQCELLPGGVRGGGVVRRTKHSGDDDGAFKEAEKKFPLFFLPGSVRDANMALPLPPAPLRWSLWAVTPPPKKTVQTLA